jgi:hypothetical protein
MVFVGRILSSPGEGKKRIGNFALIKSFGRRALWKTSYHPIKAKIIS